MRDIFRMPVVNLPADGPRRLEGIELLYRNGSLCARLLLYDLGIEEYDARNYEAACLYIHASLYLEDRLAYELCPPPDRMLLPASIFEGKSYTWQVEQCLKAGI